MIIDTNNHPENTLYYIGHEILVFLKANDSPITFGRLYEGLSLIRKISPPLLQYSLDWLYLIEAIEITPGGELKLCT